MNGGADLGGFFFRDRNNDKSGSFLGSDGGVWLQVAGGCNSDVGGEMNRGLHCLV
jgi:hypothetical protein